MGVKNCRFEIREYFNNYQVEYYTDSESGRPLDICSHTTIDMLDEEYTRKFKLNNKLLYLWVPVFPKYPGIGCVHIFFSTNIKDTVFK